MLKGKKTVMEFETYEKEDIEYTCECRNKTKKKNSGFWVTTSCTLEQVYVHMSSACVHRLDHAYLDPYPENLIYIETE